MEAILNCGRGVRCVLTRPFQHGVCEEQFEKVILYKFLKSSSAPSLQGKMVFRIHISNEGTRGFIVVLVVQCSSRSLAYFFSVSN